MSNSVLIVCTSHAKLGDTGKATGCWCEADCSCPRDALLGHSSAPGTTGTAQPRRTAAAPDQRRAVPAGTLEGMQLTFCECRAEELMAPYLAWKGVGYDVTVASMAGGKIPIDEGSLGEPYRTPEVDAFYADSAPLTSCSSVALPLLHLTPEHQRRSGSPTLPAGAEEAVKAMEESVPLKDVDASKHDVLYLPGGHGVVFDMAKDAALQKFIAGFYESGKIVSSVCHGPAAIVNVKLSTGEYLVKGKKVSRRRVKSGVCTRWQTLVTFGAGAA